MNEHSDTRNFFIFWSISNGYLFIFFGFFCTFLSFLLYFNFLFLTFPPNLLKHSMHALKLVHLTRIIFVHASFLFSLNQTSAVTLFKSLNGGSSWLPASSPPSHIIAVAPIQVFFVFCFFFFNYSNLWWYFYLVQKS